MSEPVYPPAGGTVSELKEMVPVSKPEKSVNKKRLWLILLLGLMVLLGLTVFLLDPSRLLPSF